MYLSKSRQATGRVPATGWSAAAVVLRPLINHFAPRKLFRAAQGIYLAIATALPAIGAISKNVNVEGTRI